MTNQSSLLSRLLPWNKKSTPETVDADQYAEAFGQFKKLLLEQYQIRIQAKTAKRLPINLTAKPTHFGTSPHRAALYFDDLTIESEDIATEIDKILNTHQRLLLIGDPGAGKTTILLFAAINILQDANLGGNLKLPPKLDALPLILNLATWQKDLDFKEWYAQSIAHTYSLSQVFVEELQGRNAVVPFFDGFDEVAEDSREDCFQKMAAYFGDQRNRQLIVSSRKKEYAAAAADAPVYAEIEVQPLSLVQIKKALTENAQTQAADRALLDALDHDEWLGKAVETPFYLNTASFLFGKGQRTLGDFPFKVESTEGRQAELVEIFVAEQVSEAKDRKYMGLLATKMEKENFLVFELVKMQPRWCGNKWVPTLILGVIWAFFLSLGSGNLTYGFVFGLVISFIDTKTNKITTDDIQIWSWSKFREEWVSNIIVSLFFGLLLGLLMIPFLGIIGGFVLSFFSSFTIMLLDAGTTTKHYLFIPHPYHRFWAAIRNKLPATSLVFLTINITIFCSKTSETAGVENVVLVNLGLLLTSWRTYFLLFLYPIFASDFIEHFSLRLALYLENKLPLRVVTFLDRMTDQHIFEDNRRTINGKKQRGATWRFRHKILQDYFAKMQTDPSYGSKP